MNLGSPITSVMLSQDPEQGLGSALSLEPSQARAPENNELGTQPHPTQRALGQSLSWSATTCSSPGAPGWPGGRPLPGSSHCMEHPLSLLPTGQDLLCNSQEGSPPLGSPQVGVPTEPQGLSQICHYLPCCYHRPQFTHLQSRANDASRGCWKIKR